MHGWQRSGKAVMALGLAACSVAGVGAAPQDQRAPDRRERERLAQSQRLEGQAMLRLADSAMASTGAGVERAPSDFRIRWHNEFLKAQQGTFVPFTLAIEAPGAVPKAALVYVRAVAHHAGDAGPSSERAGPERRTSRAPAAPEYPVDAIFPVELTPDTSRVARVSRGFSIAPGDYDVYVVLRERASRGSRTGSPRAAVLTQRLAVPDFRGRGLTTSSIMLADRLTVLHEPLTDDELVERPYVIGQNEIVPAVDRTFRRDEELVVVFLIYNPAVTLDKRFDIQVEYHFFRQAAAGSRGDSEFAAVPHPPERAGERYFNHTDPQRFNPSSMGAQFDPNAGHPVLAGQGVPLTGFEQGDYRLAIRITDLLSGALVTRDVNFTVGS